MLIYCNGINLGTSRYIWVQRPTYAAGLAADNGKMDCTRCLGMVSMEMQGHGSGVAERTTLVCERDLVNAPEFGMMALLWFVTKP
jgi:hypothetical protein